MKKLFITPALIGVSVSAYAIDPVPIKAGSMNVVPSLSTQSFYDDNPFSQRTGGTEQLINVVSPSVLLLMQERENLLTVDIRSHHGFYEKSSDDNFNDYSASVSGSLRLNNRHKLDTDIAFSHLHEDRGDAATQGPLSAVVSGPTEFDNFKANVQYTFGADKAKSQLELGVGTLTREYELNAVEIGNRDRRENTLSAKAYYALSSKVKNTLQVRHISIDYINESESRRANTLSSEELEYFIGLEWQATAKTNGFVKIGQGDKDFESASRQDESGSFVWGVGISWQPVSRTQFTLSSSSEEEETNGRGNFIDTQLFQLALDHNWSRDLSTRVEFIQRHEKYDSSAQDDTIDVFKFVTKKNFARWLDASIGYQLSDKSSSIEALNFDRNRIYLQLDASL